MEYDKIITNGTIIDGLRTPRYVGDIAIKDGVIAGFGRFDHKQAKEIIDATGLIVAPGFIDLHTHYDSQIYWDPYCTISGWHGVTSVVIGNCGFGFAPVKPENQERAMYTMERNEAINMETMKEGMLWDWETYPQYLDSLNRIPKGVNVLSYVGLNPLMVYVMGLEAAKSRPATDAEMTTMCELLEQALDSGGCGFSAQLMGETSIQRDYDGSPMVTDTMSEKNLFQFAEVLKKKGRGIIQTLGADYELTEKLAQLSGRPVIFNAVSIDIDQHGSVGRKAADDIAWLAAANERGNRIFGQALTIENNFEFTFENWNLYDRSPVWREATLGKPEEKLQKFKDPDIRRQMKAEYDEDDSALRITMTKSSIDGLIVSIPMSEDLAHYRGKNILTIAEEENKHVIDALLDIVVADELRTTFETPQENLDMGEMKKLANAPHILPGLSDGGAHMKFLTLGRWPTEFLSVFVRDNKIMDLEHAHWRLSTYPALAAGFKNRGFLKEGSPADIVIYDLEELSVLPSEILHDFPANDWRRSCKAKGYNYIMVNGEVTFKDGVCTDATPGQLLRHGNNV